MNNETAPQWAQQLSESLAGLTAAVTELRQPDGNPDPPKEQQQPDDGKPSETVKLWIQSRHGGKPAGHPTDKAGVSQAVTDYILHTQKKNK